MRIAKVKTQVHSPIQKYKIIHKAPGKRKLPPPLFHELPFEAKKEGDCRLTQLRRGRREAYRREARPPLRLLHLTLGFGSCNIRMEISVKNVDILKGLRERVLKKNLHGRVSHKPVILCCNFFSTI